MSVRRILLCIGLLAALVAAAYLRAESRPVAPDAMPLHDTGCWAVNVCDGKGLFDLALDADRQFELIVSSLGNASQTHSVRLEAQPHSRVEMVPTVCLPPISTRSQAPLGNAAREALFRVNENGQHADLSSRPLARRRFFLHVAVTPLEDPGGYVPVTADLVDEGEYVRVYVDVDHPFASLAPGLISEIIRLLDREIIPRGRELLGDVADIDSDGKLAVLVTPWLGRLRGCRTSINGCVRANDYQIGVDSPFGNSADLIYLNSQLEPGPALKTLLAHEYTHAVCFSRRFAREGGALPTEDDWLNEAIAHVAENLHGTDWSNLEDRIVEFLAAPGQSPLIVTDYYRAGLWRDPGCRGATYLFLRFCVDQFGPGLLGELVRSPHTGPLNLEQATGIPFPVLFRQWTIALANDRIASVALESTLGTRQLAGVQRILWRIDDGPCTVDLRGTATSVIRLVPTTEGAKRIIAHSPIGAQMQITVLRK